MELILAGAVGLAGWGVASLLWDTLVGICRSTPRMAAPFVDHWVEMVERQAKKLPLLSTQGKKAALFIILLIPPAFLLGLYVFKNMVLALLCVVLVVFAIEQKAVYRNQVHYEEINAQLAGAVRIFGAELATTPQVERAMGVVARRVPDPLRSIFSQAHRAFLSNEDPDKVFAWMAAEMPSAYGKMFVQLARMAQRGSVVTDLFGELASRITVSRELSMRARADMSGERLASLIVTAAPLPIYLFMRTVVPEINEFLADTLAGRLVVFVSFMSAIVFSILDRIVGRGIE